MTKVVPPFHSVKVSLTSVYKNIKNGSESSSTSGPEQMSRAGQEERKRQKEGKQVVSLGIACQHHHHPIKKEKPENVCAQPEPERRSILGTMGDERWMGSSTGGGPCIGRMGKSFREISRTGSSQAMAS
mmetsp:Transcript_63191/g.131432  ORF Transcript_63191/g.131432 Transcript_63191/m.131432 type:complete len:129 (+) Transcript_63191:248-634(+)